MIKPDITAEDRITIDLCDKCHRLLCCYGGKTVMLAHGFNCKYTTLTSIYEEGVHYTKTHEQIIIGHTLKGKEKMERRNLLP